MLRSIIDRGGTEVVDSLNIIGHCGFYTPVVVNVITKKFFGFRK